MKDAIGSCDMIQGSLTSFVTDRFGNANSASALNGGWTQVPSGVFFNTTQFTITVWVHPQTVGYWSRIIDFGNGQGLDNIVLSFCQTTPLPVLTSVNPSFQISSTKSLTLNSWQFLAATFIGSNIFIYIDGIQVGSGSIAYHILPSKIRTSNYIGKSNWAGDGFSSSYIDDLRFYSISLTQSQINALMNQTDTSLLLSSCQLTVTSTTSKVMSSVTSKVESTTSTLTSIYTSTPVSATSTSSLTIQASTYITSKV